MEESCPDSDTEHNKQACDFKHEHAATLLLQIRLLNGSMFVGGYTEDSSNKSEWSLGNNDVNTAHSG